MGFTLFSSDNRPCRILLTQFRTFLGYHSCILFLLIIYGSINKYLSGFDPIRHIAFRDQKIHININQRSILHNANISS